MTFGQGVVVVVRVRDDLFVSPCDEICFKHGFAIYPPVLVVRRVWRVRARGGLAALFLRDFLPILVRALMRSDRFGLPPALDPWNP